MAKSVKLKEADTFIDTEAVYDFTQGKTQATINADANALNWIDDYKAMIKIIAGE